MVCLSLNLYVYMCVCVCMCTCMCICVYVDMCVCEYVCMCVCVNTVEFRNALEQLIFSQRSVSLKLISMLSSQLVIHLWRFFDAASAIISSTSAAMLEPTNLSGCHATFRHGLAYILLFLGVKFSLCVASTLR